MTTTRHEIGRLISEDRRLFKLIYQFNYCPADYLHPSQRSRFAAGVQVDRLWRVRRCRATLSMLILRQLKLTERIRFDRDLPQWPLLLLDGERLIRVARHVGATVVSPQVRRSVARDEVLQWKRMLTPELYRFAVSTANLLPAPSTPAPSLSLSDCSIEDLGLGWINAALAGAPNELLLRARLKYPADAKPVQVRTPKAKGLVGAVLSLLEQEWCSSFGVKAA